MASPSHRSLRSLLETLPQELYDEIKDLTFTTDSDEHRIDHHVFPPLLHVSRAFRNRFSASYYGNGTFILRGWKLKKLVAWLSVLPAEHRGMVQGMGMSMTRPKDWMEAGARREHSAKETVRREFGEEIAKKVDLWWCKNDPLFDPRYA